MDALGVKQGDEDGADIDVVRYSRQRTDRAAKTLNPNELGIELQIQFGFASTPTE